MAIIILLASLLQIFTSNLILMFRPSVLAHEFHVLLEKEQLHIMYSVNSPSLLHKAKMLGPRQRCWDVFFYNFGQVRRDSFHTNQKNSLTFWGDFTFKSTKCLSRWLIRLWNVDMWISLWSYHLSPISNSIYPLLKEWGFSHLEAVLVILL